MKHLIEKAKILIDEMLPYAHKFKGRTVVIKYGGNAMINSELKLSVMKDIAFLNALGIRTVIIHGGGPEISKEMEKKGIKPKFIDGLRVTDKAIISIIKKVFRSTNSDIRSLLSELDVPTENIENAIIARQKDDALGLVGEVVDVKSSKILKALGKGRVAVISPLGYNGKSRYNINADTAATKVAVSLKAEKLTILTNVDGVIEDGNLVSHLSVSSAMHKIKSGVITAGMIPKVKACIEAVEAGCKKAHLINGTIEHSLLFEIFTYKGIGTEIAKNGNQ